MWTDVWTDVWTDASGEGTAAPRAQPPCRTLAEYVTLLVERLGVGEPALLARLREVVGGRAARIALDDEAVEVRFAGDALVVRQLGAPDGAPGDAPAVDGDGGTDRLTTLDLLDGYAEVTDAILDGRLRAAGDIENLARIGQAVEVLLDGATRIPALQRLARDYREDPCRAARPPWRARPGPAAAAGMVDVLRAEERERLRRLDLLP